MTERPLTLRYAARSHVGMVRAKNDDSAYAGKYLAVVADGMGGHAGGDVASASTVLDLVHLDRDGYNDDAGTHLADEIQTANSLLSELVHVNPKLAGMGTTVTALLLSEGRLAYAHIGDSRAYRLKDGIFEQMSTDHTFVQRMIDEGRMTPAEAEVHPHKNVLMRVLGDVDASPELDLKYFDAAVGERWLLCSDGLNFVRPEIVEEVVRHSRNLADCADTLIDLTLAAGSPDNVTVVVFEVAEDSPDDTSTQALNTISAVTAIDDFDDFADTAGVNHVSETDQDPASLLADDDEPFDDADPALPGAAGAEVDGAGATAGLPGGGKTEDIGLHIRAAVVREELAMRPHELVGAAVTANDEGKIPQLAEHPASRRAAMVLTHKPNSLAPEMLDETEESIPLARHRKLVLSIIGGIAVIAIVAGSWVGYAWTQTQYYVGVSNGHVAIYTGVSQSLGPISLSHVYQETTITVTSLPEYSQQRLQQTLPAPDLATAQQIISDLQLGTGSSTPPCSSAPVPSLTPTPPPGKASGTPKPSPSVKAGPTAKATPSSSRIAADPLNNLATPTCTGGAP